MRDDQLTRYREKLVHLQAQVMAQTRETVDRMAEEAATPDELSHVPTHPADRDTEGLDSEMTVEANYEQILEDIESAFERIEQGTYGRCVDCGAQIPATRLDVLPFASRCVECQARHEQ